MMFWRVHTHTHTHAYTQVVAKVLDLKWKTFGLKIFCIKEAWFLLHLIFFMLSHVGDPSGCRIDSQLQVI